MALRAQNIAVLRGERLVLRAISLAVAPGGALLLEGPNGAGKSTLLRLLAGFARPDAGVVAWADADIAADPPAHAARTFYLGHQDAVKPGLTAAENLALAARLAGVGRPAIEAALAALGLAALADLPARMLSAGQRRRLALSRLALGHAPLWLLDEPTLGLDTASVGAFGRLLAAHRARGGLVVAATHLPLPLPGAETLRLGAA